MTGGGGVMVFRPTLEEFKDFVKYVEYMESQGAAEYGVAKIIPPEGWYACKDMQTKLKEQNIIIGSPVYQEISSTHVGVYQQLNIVQDSINLDAFQHMAQSEQHCAPEGTIEELEEKYWKSLTFNPPLYGADVMGSLYDSDVQDWNVDKLGDILDNVCDEMGVDIPGVNTPYLYFGMWKSTFAWHVEDMDLFSLNYLHFGEPKFWYAIPQKHAGRFETMVRGVYPESYKQCKEFIRHKMTVVSPKNLAKSGIPVNRMVQRAGEFMVTFPRGYHSGFNMGYNAAESANFALHRWVELGKKSKICYCFSDSVSINMNQFIQAYNECYGKNVAKVKHKNARKTTKTKVQRKAISDKKKTAINRRRKHKNNMSKSTRVSKKKTAKKLLKMYALHSMDHDLELEPPDEFDVILDSEDDSEPAPALPKSLATFLPKKHLSVRIHKTPQSPTKKPRSLMSKKSLRNVRNMLKYNCYKPELPQVPCTKGQVDDTTISISEIFKAVEREGGEEEIECELEEVPDIFSEEPVRPEPLYTTPLKSANNIEASVPPVETVLNEGTAQIVNSALNDGVCDTENGVCDTESVVDVVEPVPQEHVVAGPEMGGKVFCPTIGVDDPVIDVGPIRKAKRKRKRKPSFGSSGPRLNQKLVSSVGYIHCRYPRKEKAKKAPSVKKLKSEKLKPDTEAHPAVVKMRRVAWIFDHNYSHCKVKVYRLENDDGVGVSSEYDTRIESSTKAKTELTYYLPNCVWNRNILSLEHNLFVYRNFPKNKDIVKEKVYMFDDQPPAGSPYGKRNKQRKEKSPVPTPEEFDIVESPPAPGSPPPEALPALEVDSETSKRPPAANSIPSYGQHKNYKLNPLHGNKHLPIDMTRLSGNQREEYIQWVIKTGQRTADFRVWGHQDDDDGRIYKTKLSNELNQFKSSIEHNTLDPVVKAAFIKELNNMKFASHIQEQPDIKPIIEQQDKRPYEQDNQDQESSQMLNQMKYVAPIYDPDDYRIGPRYQPEVPESPRTTSTDPRPRHMQYSSITNKPLYKVSPFTHPPAPAMNPIKVKDNYGPVVEEEPIFTYSPPKHHPPGFKPTTVIPEEGTRVRAVNSLRLPTMDELYRQQRHPHFFQYPPVSASNAVFEGEEQCPQPSASYGTTKGMIYENWYPNTG